jgi:Na+-driven multidrug efflux pump
MQIKKFIVQILIRVFLVCSSLFLLYLYAERVFAHNRMREHPVDAGLGIALLLFFVVLILFIGFFIDAIYIAYKKEYFIIFVNMLFMAVFSLPMLYINCQMEDYCESCFCSNLIEWVKKI